MSNVISQNRNLFPRVISLFDNYFDGAPNWLEFNDKWPSFPAANVAESNESIKVELAAPGKKKEDFKIELLENTLSISSESEAEKEETEGDMVRKEFSYDHFRRSFTLPKNALVEKISAKYEDGVLKVTVPKSEKAQANQKIIQID